MKRFHVQRRRALFGTLVCIVALAAGVACSGPRPTDTTSSLGKPRASGGSLSLQSASTPSASEVTRIQNALDSVYLKTDVLYSFRTVFGEDIDCIDFNKEPSVKALAAAGKAVTPLLTNPPLPPNFTTGPKGSASPDISFNGQPDQDGHPRRCPPGSVAHARITVDQILRAGGLDAYSAAVHSKGFPSTGQSPPPPGNGSAILHDKAIYPSNGSKYAGIGGFLNVFKPLVHTYAYPWSHSLAQTWVTNSSTGGPIGDPTVQTVEMGWEVEVFGDGNPYPQLFIYSTKDGYGQTGCYNNVQIDKACVPFVPKPNSLYATGVNIPYGIAGTSEYEILIATINYNGSINTPAGWYVWVWAQGGSPDILGYYRADAFAQEMQRTAVWQAIGGEVLDYVNYNGVQMGSGNCPQWGFPWAAYVYGFGVYCQNYAPYVFCAGVPGQPVQFIQPSTFSLFGEIRADYGYSQSPAAPPSRPGPYFYYGGDGTGVCPVP